MLRKILLVLFVGLLANSAALAEGFYAGAGFGITQIEDEDQGLSFKDSPFGWRLLAGYDFSDSYAIEGSYVNSGEAEDDVQGTNVKAELSAFVVSLVGLIPVSDNSRLFGKLGYYSGEEEVTAFGVTIDDDDSGLTVGAGLRYDTGNNFVVRGDFDWFDTDLDTVWSIGVGIQYFFGN